MSPSLSSKRGFTLLEVMISVAILAFLAIATTESIQRAVRSKAKVQKQIDRTSEVRDALRIMERDINLAFNYRDINVELYNAAIEERKKRQEQDRKKGNNDDKGEGEGQDGEGGEGEDGEGEKDDGGSDQLDNPGWKSDGGPGGSGEDGELQKKEQVILTHFKGSEEDLHFTSLSNIRSTVDSKESDQAEVGYYVETCTNRVNKKHRSQCLWRRTSPYIDDDITQGGTATPLLENVKEFKLRYLGPGSVEEWVSQWHSDQAGDAVTQGKFPYAVEITIETKDESREDSKATRMTLVASLRFPNNPKKEEAGDATSGTPQAPGSFPSGP